MKTRAACFVLIAEFLLSLSASATSLVKMSLEQLTQASSAVLQGRVISQVSQWNSTQTEIVTLTTIAVDQNVKGKTPATVVVQQPGGTLGRFRVYVPGTIRFYPQSRYMLFLERKPSAAANYDLVGMVQGAYRIYRDPQTRQERVIKPIGHFFYSKGSATQPASALPETMPLSEFQQRVSSELAKPVVIPSGTAIPLVVRSASSSGVGRILVEAETTMDLFPSTQVVIPAGSTVDGWGREVAGKWVLQWTAVSIRGRQARIAARSQMPLGGNLRGERLTVTTR